MSFEHVSIEKRIKATKKAIANPRTPKQFKPSMRARLAQLQRQARGKRA